MKHILTAPVSQRLILTRDELLSSFAFKFNLRRYLQVTPAAAQGAVAVVVSAAAGTSVATGEASSESSQFSFPYDAVKPTAGPYTRPLLSST